AAICAFCETWTLTTAGEHDALTLACARHEALHSASALGGRTYPSHFGACHWPWQRAWQVASHVPWQSPEQAPAHSPLAFRAEQVPLQLPVQRPSHRPEQIPWQYPESRPGSQRATISPGSTCTSHAPWQLASACTLAWHWGGVAVARTEMPWRMMPSILAEATAQATLARAPGSSFAVNSC